MAISVDLSKPLVSKLLVNGRLQLVEYESLPVICFHCGCYGHAQEGCPELSNTQPPCEPVPNPSSNVPPPSDIATAYVSFGPWMVAARRICKQFPVQTVAKTPPANNFGQTSRFSPLLATDSDGVHAGHYATAGFIHASSTASVPQRPVAVKSLAKKKSTVAGKTSKPAFVKKPLTVNLSDFPALSRFSHKASSSKAPTPENQSIILDKSKHSAIVMTENDNPNIIERSSLPPVLNAECSSCPPLGDPPDPKQQLGIGTRDSQHAPHVPGMADNSLIDSAATAVDNSLLPGGSQEVPMIE
ncbi:hypothetical protein V6N13_091929 [Hibiscus sabdariffa]